MVHTCNLCNRHFATTRGLKIHQAHCKQNDHLTITNNNPLCEDITSQHENMPVETALNIDFESELSIEREICFNPNMPSYLKVDPIPYTSMIILMGFHYSNLSTKPMTK